MSGNGDRPTRWHVRGPETIHESDRAVVTRVFLPDRTVVRKEPRGSDAARRLRREREMLARLAGVDGVAHLAAGLPDEPGSIFLVDVYGASLADLRAPLDPDELLFLAVEVARGVAGMHARGVMHRDISPRNVVMSTRDRRPLLIDFALATSIAEMRPEFTHPAELVGTLAYLAPEQTGRTARPVDHRADLYALGGTLYELATGHPPFGTGDPLRLVHDHLARVPTPPHEVNPAVPTALSAVVMHLLEKEPDNRYQSADGLVHDLTRLTTGAPLDRPGAHDFPTRLRPPSQLAGRASEIAELEGALDDAMSGRASGLLVSGPPGVGKTSLVDELRPMVAARDGWFVSGKFDRSRHDQEFDAVRQAFRGLGRLLLAEPEERLVDVRRRLRERLGYDAGFVAAAVPEFQALLGVAPNPGDPLTARARSQRTGVEILRAVASRDRPLVFVVDDLQWATSRTPLELVDAVFSGARTVEGLLLVCAYREGEVDAPHLLSSMLDRWRRDGPGRPRQLRLANLPVAPVASMVADMLRLSPPRAAELAAVVTARTDGNPFDTVELLNTLRHEGVLTADPDGLRWNPAEINALAPGADVVDLLAARIGRMPPATRRTLQTMAFLGGRAAVSLLRVATGLTGRSADRALLPALDDGLLVLEPGPRGTDAVRFRHDHVQDASLRLLAPPAARLLRLSIARRLARQPELFSAAAEQYLLVDDAVDDPRERARMKDLFRHAADQAKVLSNHLAVERFLARAAELTDPDDVPALIDVLSGQHAALYGLGQLERANEVFRMIDKLATEPEQRTDAVVTQVSSLTNQRRLAEAVDLGVEQLRRLGLAVPDATRLPTEIAHGLEALYRWLDGSDDRDDLLLPDDEDPTRLARAALINRLFAPTFFHDRTLMAWMTLEALAMWREHGPSRALVGPVTHVTYTTIAQRDDYQTGYRTIRRVLAVSRARGYEPETSLGRFQYVAATSHWFEPIEDTVRQAYVARDGLLDGGDLQNANWLAHPLAYGLLDSAESLDTYAAEIDGALAFAARTGNEASAETLRVYRLVATTLRDEPGDAAPPEPDAVTASPWAIMHSHIVRAVIAAVLDDRAELARHSAAITPLLPVILGHYSTTAAHMVRALALANEIRAAPPGTAAPQLAELGRVADWLADRAADAPANFSHLLHWVNAERAWAVGDFEHAARCFDQAQRAVADRRRPWHRALILERSARFYLEHGLDSAGHDLLADARRQYRSWGAAAKVRQLDWAYPGLGPAERRTDAARPSTADAADRRSTISQGTLDLLGIFAAAQAISSETTIAGLRARVVETLSAMTGATDVHLLLWSDDERAWLMSTPDGDTCPAESAPTRTPLSVVHYAERVREPFVVADAVRDDRFARDAYLAGLDCCSLLVVPIFNRGALRSLLILENRLIRGGFSIERLDRIDLIAAQLAVSIDNVLTHAALEQRVTERTRQLAVANRRLEQLSITDPLTGLANRRRLEDVLAAEWQRARRLGTPIGLAIVDIDYFKLYNDHYGHIAGDRCLQRVAAQLEQHVRERDLAARYGGEEFAVVMPDTTIDAAIQICEHVRHAVVALDQPHPRAAEGHVTVSVGAAAETPRRGSPGHLMEAADTELYRAKRTGRNRVHGTSVN